MKFLRKEVLGIFTAGLAMIAGTTTIAVLYTDSKREDFYAGLATQPVLIEQAKAMQFSMPSSVQQIRCFQVDLANAECKAVYEPLGNDETGWRGPAFGIELPQELIPYPPVPAGKSSEQKEKLFAFVVAGKGNDIAIRGRFSRDALSPSDWTKLMLYLVNNTVAKSHEYLLRDEADRQSPPSANELKWRTAERSAAASQPASR